MNKVLGLLLGATLMVSIPVLAAEQVLGDRELDTVTAGTASSASAIAISAVGSTVTIDYDYNNGYVHERGHYVGLVPLPPNDPAVPVLQKYFPVTVELLRLVP